MVSLVRLLHADQSESLTPVTHVDHASHFGLQLSSSEFVNSGTKLQSARRHVGSRLIESLDLRVLIQCKDLDH